jgi:hypothetical protein
MEMRRMRFFWIILAFLVTLTYSNEANAQRPTGRVLVDTIFESFESRTSIQTLGGIYGQLDNETSINGRISIAPGTDFMLIGVCDEMCSNIDLVLLDSSGREVGSDTLEDDFPTVEFSSGLGGIFSYELKMVACASTCNWGVRLYPRPANSY